MGMTGDKGWSVWRWGRGTLLVEARRGDVVDGGVGGRVWAVARQHLSSQRKGKSKCGAVRCGRWCCLLLGSSETRRLKRRGAVVGGLGSKRRRWW